MRYFDVCSNKIFWLKESLLHTQINDTWSMVSRVEKLSKDELSSIVFEKKRNLLTHAVRTVPYYVNWFRNRGIAVNDVRLSDFPVITKKDIRE